MRADIVDGCRPNDHAVAIEGLRSIGVEVFKVADTYETDLQGAAISRGDLSKWFVSVPAESSLAPLVAGIPLATDEGRAWELAVQYLRRR